MYVKPKFGQIILSSLAKLKAMLIQNYDQLADGGEV